jgi:hypothetical protein
MDYGLERHGNFEIQASKVTTLGAANRYKGLGENRLAHRISSRLESLAVQDA